VHRISTSIDIAATAERVCGVLVDFSAYPRALTAAVFGACFSLIGCGPGPTLGTATDVVITARNVTEGPDAYICERFNPTAGDVTRFLNSAIIITPYEEHDEFMVGPCDVEGTARFRGIEATWVMNVLGTGRITIYTEFTYLIADDTERVDSDE
jgi:hypothetical protein